MRIARRSYFLAFIRGTKTRGENKTIVFSRNYKNAILKAIDNP
jgi:hypothetical protein